MENLFRAAAFPHNGREKRKKEIEGEREIDRNKGDGGEGEKFDGDHIE